MKITVTQPALPPLDEYIPYLRNIWESKWIANQGPYHELFERELANYLGVEFISLFVNGTLALITALQALNIKGEVITTPYSFVASSHSLWWNNIKPVFVDIEKESFNINPDKIEAAITEKTTAILPVHVYGNPCRTEEIKKIADRYHLKVIYDAAHAFGVKKNSISILSEGDLSILSFHATKVFNTIEGGAIICHDERMKHHIDNLKNFGFRDETIVEEPGINAKMNELQAAYGLLQLKYVKEYISKRKLIATTYRDHLQGITGLRYLADMDGIQHNYAYFPIFVDHKRYGIGRDELYDKLKQYGIYGRRYFYPLISDFPMYNKLESSSTKNIPIASKVAKQVICLPIYPDLEIKTVKQITGLLRKIKG